MTLVGAVRYAIYLRARQFEHFPPRNISVWLSVAALLLAAAACGRAKKRLVVGAESSTEQAVVAEIVAQHLEHRLERKVERRTGLGDELNLYQAVVGGEVTLYPDYAASVETVILKERADSDPRIVLERTRNELRRTAQLELLDPLGYDAAPVVVVKSSQAAKAHVKTLSDAENGTTQWRLGVSFDFQQRADGLAFLSSYKIPMSQGVRGMDPAALFPALEQEQVNMLVASATDGHLAAPGFTLLADDRKAIPPYQACLVVRQDALAAEPKLRAALEELSGKLDLATVRKLNAAVELERRRPADVATEFLSAAGLK